MLGHQFDQDLSRYLIDAAAAAGTDVNSLLRRVLNVDPVQEDPRFLPYLKDLPAMIGTLLETVDRALRILNPGVHRVFRNNYIGYRRPNKVADGPTAERSQIFVSLRPRRKGVAAILPLDPEPFVAHAAVRDMRGVGHHGVGDLQFEIGTPADLDDFLRTFQAWLSAD